MVRTQMYTAADSRETAATDLIEGRFGAAVGGLQRWNSDNPGNTAAQLELACALAADRRGQEANELLERIPPSGLAPKEIARRLTAEAYLLLRSGRTDEGYEKLKAACGMDPTFAPALFSYGRALLFDAKRPEDAVSFLSASARAAPSSLAAHLGEAAADTERDDYASAWRKSLSIVGRFPLSAKAWIALVVASILASLLKGRVAVAVLIALMFLPNVAVPMLASWIVFAALSFILLRRSVPRYALYPAIALVPLLLALILRVMILGKAIP